MIGYSMCHVSNKDNKVVILPIRNRAKCLTDQDKKDVWDFRGRATAEGYGKLTIHTTEPEDGVEGRDYVAAYRTGEVWSTWGFARNGDIVCSWNAQTSEDVGTFKSMSKALNCILVRNDKRFGHCRAEKC